ncbi:hypothetical protein Tco_0790529 [Tanacetum coccineum]
MEEDAEKEELKGFLDIIPREEVPIEVESISTKFPIVDWKTCVLTENFMYYQEELYKTSQESIVLQDQEGYESNALGNLYTLFEPDEDDEI